MFFSVRTIEKGGVRAIVFRLLDANLCSKEQILKCCPASAGQSYAEITRFQLIVGGKLPCIAHPHHMAFFHNIVAVGYPY